jgi:hypothetical protein
MTEQPQQSNQPSQPFNIDLTKIMPTIANLYKQFSWAIPIIEKMTGYKIPAEIITALNTLSEGKPLTPEQMQAMRTSIETMQPQVGEPVMTRQLAETAYFLHTKEGKGTREIAEMFTKDGNPCSHATVARWINIIEQEKRFGKIARAIQIAKIAGFIGIIALAFWIGKTFF